MSRKAARRSVDGAAALRDDDRDLAGVRAELDVASAAARSAGRNACVELGDYGGRRSFCVPRVAQHHRREVVHHPPIIEAYIALHHAGDAHSVEVWSGEELVGGLYGVDAGGVFTGESMFHRAPNASKLALSFLVLMYGRENRARRASDVAGFASGALLLGYAAFPEPEILGGVRRLAVALRSMRSMTAHSGSP